MSFDEKNLNEPKERGKITISVVGNEQPCLVTACLFADAVFKVFYIDSGQYIANHVKRELLTITELETKSLLERNLNEGRLIATTEFKLASSKSNILFLYTSPRIDQKKRSDYSNIEKICRDIGLNLQEGTLVILEGNVTPGVTQTMVKETLETASGLKDGGELGLAYCSIPPSFHRRSKSKHNCPSVYSAIDKRSSKLTKVFLSIITEGEVTQVNNMKLLRLLQYSRVSIET